MPYSAQELEPHNPVDTKNLAEGIVRRISLQPARPLPPDAPFIGAGVYLLYYVGSADLYAPVAALNKDEKFTLPIYVGKADPKGTRKGHGWTLSPARRFSSGSANTLIASKLQRISRSKIFTSASLCSIMFGYDWGKQD